MIFKNVFFLSLLIIGQVNCTETARPFEDIAKDELEFVRDSADIDNIIANFLTRDGQDLELFLVFSVSNPKHRELFGNILRFSFEHGYFNLIKYIIQNNIELSNFKVVVALARDGAVEEYNRTFKHKTHKHFLKTYVEGKPGRIKQFKNMIHYLMMCEEYLKSQMTKSALSEYADLNRKISVSEAEIQQFMTKHDNYSDGWSCAIL